MWRHTRTALVAAALAAVACDHTRAAAGVETRRVLFVGNSLTTTNDLPAMVESLSVGGGGPRLDCHAVAFPGYSLEDHWNRGDAARAIGAGGWAAVVLQQGPSALPESRALLVEYARRFDAVVVWKFDRFARSTSHLLRALESFRDLGVEFVSLTEAVDTTTAAGKMVFVVLAAVAELERSLIVERVKAGLRNARAKGKRLGRPRIVVNAIRIAGLRAEGRSWSVGAGSGCQRTASVLHD